jgi:hypothetical protein
MPVNTLSVATAVTPTVIETWLSHYLNRKPLRQKPTAHISYHEGLELIRRFLYYASFHTVDELQAFTQQWVPIPHWVHDQVVDISASLQTRSAELIQAQLGPEGIRQVGGKTWWQWRREGTGLKAEWIEMRKDFEERKKTGNIKGQRVMLYVHGGAYYFGSVDEHRYQMQRHARKLKARVLAPKYRLAPQFPFPCGLQDCECCENAMRVPELIGCRSGGVFLPTRREARPKYHYISRRLCWRRYGVEHAGDVARSGHSLACGSHVD